MKHFLKVFLITVLSLSIVGGVGTKLYLDHDDKKKKEERAEIVSLDEKQGPKQRVNILLLGVDAPEKDRKGDIPRSDTMMLLSLDPQTNTSFILSIPRDTRVILPGRSNYTKINHAHRFGGPELSIQAVKELLGVPINHYVVVDYKALFEIVDAIGGVDMTVEQPGGIHYDDNAIDPPLHIHFDQGVHHLNGQKAMEFLRWRKGKRKGEGYAGGDLGRIEAQQKFISAVIEKVLSPETITKVPKIMDTMYQYVETDMSKKEILELGVGAVKLKPTDIIKDVLPGQSAYLGRAWYYIMDSPVYKEQISYMMSGNYSDWASNKFHERSTLDIVALSGSEGGGKRNKHTKNTKKQDVTEIPVDMNIYDDEAHLDEQEQQEVVAPVPSEPNNSLPSDFSGEKANDATKNNSDGSQTIDITEPSKETPVSNETPSSSSGQSSNSSTTTPVTPVPSTNEGSGSSSGEGGDLFSE